MMGNEPGKTRQHPFSPYWFGSVVFLFLFLTSSIFVLVTSPAFAAGSPPKAIPYDNPPFPNGPQGPERYGGTNPSEYGQLCACNAGDPVDTFSGNFSETFTDFSLPGRGVPLLLTHTYNAQQAAQSTSPGPLGFGWSDSYEMFLDSFATVHQENGSTVPFTDFSISGFVPPSRVLATLVQTNNGYTFTREQTQMSYHFNVNGLLVSESDRNGYVTTLAYNSSNQLTSVTDPAGRSLTFAYNGSGLIASVTDPNSRTVSFAYDANSNLISVTDANGGVTKFTYTSSHLLLTMTDPNGGVLTNTYDSSSQVTSQADMLGRITTFSYGTNTTTITNPNGFVTVEHFHNALLVSKTTGAGTAQAATWTYAYNPYCNGLQAITDPNGHTTYQTWDIYGNKLSTTDALGRVTKYTYDNMNDLTSVTDPLSVTTTLTYDTKGNLLSISTPLTGTSSVRTTTFTYGDTTHPGDMTAVTDPDGNIWNYTYDANGDRTSVADPLGDKTAYQYNSIGWLTSQTTALSHITSYTYDHFGDVTLVTDPLGHKTTMSYDANRNLATVVDAAGNTTQYSYDLDNELTRITRADGSILSYRYNGDGNQTAYTDGLGNQTTYAYTDAAFPNTITAVTDPLNRTTRYGYDLAGNLTSLTNPSTQATTYSYDAANELTSINYSDGKTPNVSFTYDADGQRSKMTDGTGSTTYTYDSLNRLMQSTNGAGSTVAYRYDLKGQLIGLTYPGGQQVTRTYDAAGRLKTVKDWLSNTTSFIYDADSNLTAQTYPNTVKATFKYDLDDQVINIADKLGTTSLLSFAYTRSSLSLLASMTPTGVPQSKETYAYTALNQLSTVNQPTYQYDHGDNLTQMGNATLSYDAADELKTFTQSSNTTTFTYNAQGDLTQQKSSSSTINFTYDQANRLTAYGTTATYSYNGDGLRMSKTVSGTSEAFTWDTAEGLPLILQDGSSLYVSGPNGLPLEQVNGSTVLSYHQDQLGSTRTLTNASGTVVATYGYDAYGNVTGHTGSVTNPFQYAGQYTDAESGLQYLRTRYYDPAIDRFLTLDLLTSITHEPYVYSVNNPLNRDDPTGLMTGTSGLCLNFNGGIDVGGVAAGCVVADQNGLNLTFTLGGGFQTPAAGISVSYQKSDAVDAKALSGPFTYIGASGGLKNVGVQYAYGQDCRGNDVHVGEVSVGAGIAPLIEVHGGVSTTWVITPQDVANWFFHRPAGDFESNVA